MVDVSKLADDIQKDKVIELKKPQQQKIEREQELLNEFMQSSPVFTEQFVLPFLENRGILKSALLRNIKALVKDKANYYGYNHEANLINTEKGVLNIETGKLEARGKRIFDRKLPKYDPEAQAPAFKWLLNNYNTDEYPNLSEDLLKLFSYALFGNNKLKTFFIAHGNGDNAKSTLWNMVENALGSVETGGYASKVASETFTTSKKNDKFNVGLSSLNNSRFSFSDEMKQGVELNGNLIKQLVAGEQSTVKFEEKGKGNQTSANIIAPVMMLVNDVPDFQDADQATINRTVVIEFTKQFAKNDPQVKEMIDKAMNEQAGIFNLIVEAYDPKWVVPERWIKDAQEMINNQVFDDDVVYTLEIALGKTVEQTHDNKDKVRQAELHHALEVNYYDIHGQARPSRRRLHVLLPANFDIGVHGNYYTRILLK